MSKLRRLIEEGAAYHVVSTTRGREPTFAHHAYAIEVVNALQYLRSRCYLLSYVVMPDHVHAIVVPKANQQLSKLMQSLKGYTSRRINLTLRQQGSLWQQSFYDRMIRDERQLLETISYIDMNPVVAGLVERPERYAHSSAERPELTDLDAFYTDEQPTAEAGKPRLQVIGERGFP